MTRLAEVEPAAWDDLLAHLGCADVYYLAEYLEGARLLEPGTPAFLHLEGDGGDIVFPLLVREAPRGCPRRDHAVRLRRAGRHGP